MSRRKKINKFKVAIVVFALLVFFMSVTGLGRFTYNAVRDRYLSSKKFYFFSNLLTSNGETYEYENWDGIGIYEIKIKMFSKNNDLERFDDDLKYSVKLDYNNTNIECSLKYDDFSLATGNEYYTEEADGTDNRQTIDDSTNEDELVVYVKPKEGKTLNIGQVYNIKVTAYTSDPYRKNIEGTFKIKISDVAFEVIEDKAGVPFIIMNVKNTRDYDSNVTINLKDITKVRLDMADFVAYDVQHDTDESTKVTTDANNVVTSITFKMPKETSRNIKFYKNETNDPKVASTYQEWLGIFSIKREKNS